MKSFGKGNRTIADEESAISELLELVNVDIHTGIITSKVNRRKWYVGDVVGCKTPKGYWCIKYNGVAYRRHRIVWYFVHGYLPLILDHIRGVENGDGIDNLMAVDQRKNTLKASIRNDNTSGYKGINWHKASGKWNVRVSVVDVDGNKKRINGGVYSDITQAVKRFEEITQEYSVYEK